MITTKAIYLRLNKEVSELVNAELVEASSVGNGVENPRGKGERTSVTTQFTGQEKKKMYFCW